MSERVTDTWSWRDQPVLSFIVEQYDAGGHGMLDVRRRRVAELVALSEREVGAALAALLGAGYIAGTRYAGGLMVSRVSAEARRETGHWPPTDLSERYLAALEQLIAAANGQERTRLEALRSASSDVGKTALGDLLARAVTGIASAAGG